jgi:tyrosinase
MLHHANVDRIWAYWQAIKPEIGSMSQSYQGKGRFSTPSGATITPRSPLEPFRRSEGEYHTPDSAQSIQDFGYTYPALEFWDKSPEQIRDDVARLINRLYGPNSTASAFFSRNRRGPFVTRYFANIGVEASELERPCSINIIMNGTIAGSMIVMMQPAEGVIRGAVSLDGVVGHDSSRELGADEVLQSVLRTMEVEIVKVCLSRNSALKNDLHVS